MPGVSGEINLNDPSPDFARERFDAAKIVLLQAETECTVTQWRARPDVGTKKRVT
jgi:hypothetical protein